MAQWQLWALGTAFFAGLTAVLAKVGVQSMSSNLATLVRTGVVIIFLLIVVTVRHEWASVSSITKKSALFLFLSGLATGISWLLYFRALQSGGVTTVSSLDKLSLPIAVLLSMIFLGENPTVWQWGGVVLITVGALLVMAK